MATHHPQRDIDRQNKVFWNEACGTDLARSLGIMSHSQDSLDKFDRTYMDIYPYLAKYLADFKEHRVLEIGVGYGTVAQKLVAGGAQYYALDIASGPVNIVNHRMRLLKLNNCGIIGSALDLPFSNDSFDACVSIGCLHHTGHVQRAVDEIHRVLKPGGRTVVMLYNRFSLRRWRARPLRVLREWLAGGNQANSEPEERADYDVNSAGDEAPFTEFSSRAELRRLFRMFASVDATRENIDDLFAFGILRLTRKQLLSTLAHWCGRDWYVVAVK